LPKALYTTGFDEITQKWHKNPGAPDAILPAVRIAMALEGFSVAEALLISPTVCCRVYGENVVLCRLIDAFGVAGVEQLLEENALQFLLWRPMIVHLHANQTVTNEKGEPVKNAIDPLAPGNASTPAHSDPQASVEMGLKGGWTTHPWTKLERLAGLAVERTHLPAANVPYDAVGAVRAAYDRGALRRTGLAPETPRHDLPDEQRAQLAKLAEDTAVGLVLCDLEFDLHESDWEWNRLLRFAEIVSAPSPVASVQRGMALEHLPNVPALLATRVITFADVVKLRQHPATAELRKWLWSQPDPRDAEDVSRAWLAAIQHAPVKDRTWFKIARLTTLSALGAGVGALIAPDAVLPGIGVGAGISGVIGAADTFGLERLLSKPSPRRFAELIRGKVAATTRTGAANRKEHRAAASKSQRECGGDGGHAEAKWTAATPGPMSREATDYCGGRQWRGSEASAGAGG